MMAKSSRPIATWRWATGTLSPISAKEIGHHAAGREPATMRPITKTSKLGAMAQTMVALAKTNRHSSISRALLNMSASAPSSGCTSA